MEYPRVNLKVWRSDYGFKILEYVENYDTYASFWRRASLTPNYEQCFIYPQWANNYVMMVEDFLTGDIIGFVNGYSADFRNGIIYAGILIDEAHQGKKFGHAASVEWFHYLFNALGFRKVCVEIVDDTLIAPLLNLGFMQVGRRISHVKLNGKWADEFLLDCHIDDWKGL